MIMSHPFSYGTMHHLATPGTGNVISSVAENRILCA